MLFSASFHCLVEERKDGEELEPTPKVKWTFVDQKGEARKHRTECRAAAIKLSVFDVRKKQHTFEDTREM